MIHRAVFQPVRCFEARLIHGQLPFLPLGPAERPFAARRAVDTAEISVQVKMVEVQPRCGGCDGQREVVDPGRLTGELHAVVYRVFTVLRQNQMRVHIAKILGHCQVESHSLPGGNCPERGFAGSI